MTKEGEKVNEFKNNEMKKVIDITWNNPEGKELRDKLFPNGKPEPEEFIRVISRIVKERSFLNN